MLPTNFCVAILFALLGGFFAERRSLGTANRKIPFDEKAVAEFYRGKTVRIIIGSGAGGTYDIYSRLLSKHMPRFIPGNPPLLVQPRVGAGGLIAANAVYNAEPRDGTVVGSFGETFVLRQAIGAPGIQFDSNKYQWIGSAINAPHRVRCAERLRRGVVPGHHRRQAVYYRHHGAGQHDL